MATIANRPKANRPKFTREHMEALAEALGRADHITSGNLNHGVWVAIGAVIRMLESDNPNFNSKRFTRAIEDYVQPALPGMSDPNGL